jgi:putative Mg2+ transporter-C (MgtC) family protein
MLLIISYPEVVLRLALTLVAGAVFGFNRGERAHPAGLRTTVLVSVAAAASMIQVNLLLGLAEHKPALVGLDLMRLPLGILSGMGFIGGGAILKKGDIVHGVTTAATLWFVTVMGLCFGGGQLALGLLLLAIGVFVLWVLKWVERRFAEARTATLTLTLRDGGPSEADVRARLSANDFEVLRCAVTVAKAIHRRRMNFEIHWRPHQAALHTPRVVEELMATEGVASVKWEPK